MIDLLTLTQSAQLAGVNPASLRHAIIQGRLASIKPGRDHLVERAEIERYIAERRTWRNHRRVEMHYSDTLPNHVIVEHDGALWLAPVTPGGWERRQPYRGHVEALHPFGVGGRLVLATIGYPLASD